MSEDTTDRSINKTIWRCHERSGPSADGPWEFRSTITADEPDEAARRFVVGGWASGTHSVLVVSSEQAREYKVTIETDEIRATGH